ncbi:MAG TPA: glycosyltransferase family protein [Candidatus Angelobacter sp.]|nr:glycosyltransferase family protein [Candidatus Angelobacter sp.]
MANILYGVNGEGSGHSTRASEVITHLQSQGHTVRVVSFDRGLRNLKEKFDVTEIFGLRIAYVNNRMRYRRTLAKNLINAPRAARSLGRLLRQAEEWKIELVITDFEPLTCHVGRHRRLPVISIDNQHCLTNVEVSIPSRSRRDAAAAKLLTRLMTPHAQAYLVTSFFPARVRRRNTFLFPPILRSEVLAARSTLGEHLLVYVTSPSPELARLLQQVRASFVAYGFAREGQEGNILFKKPSMEGFLADLASCKAIVANAGFSLVSEALHLGKPYLAVPVRNQFEQIFNAYYLHKTGYGAWWRELNKERVESFLFNLPTFAENLARYPRQGNSALLNKLDELIAQLKPSARK